jgi:hypothetical protein
MLRHLSEDLVRLEGIGRAQAQLCQRSMSDFERHVEKWTLNNVLSSHKSTISLTRSDCFVMKPCILKLIALQIVMEKRLGIAQLCLLLAVLVFLSVTRGFFQGVSHTARQ